MNLRKYNFKDYNKFSKNLDLLKISNNFELKRKVRKSNQIS